MCEEKRSLRIVVEKTTQLNEHMLNHTLHSRSVQPVDILANAVKNERQRIPTGDQRKPELVNIPLVVPN